MSKAIRQHSLQKLQTLSSFIYVLSTVGKKGEKKAEKEKIKKKKWMNETETWERSLSLNKMYQLF